jgi:hypothetical protein
LLKAGEKEDVIIARLTREYLPAPVVKAPPVIRKNVPPKRLYKILLPNKRYKTPFIPKRYNAAPG